MLADFIPAKKGQHGHWDYYICSRKKNSRVHKCACRRVGARGLEQAVVDSLMTHVLTRENLRPLADTIAQQLMQTNTDAGVRLDAVRTELEQVERQIDNLLRAIEDMGLSPSLREKLTKCEADKERLCTEVLRLEKMIVKARDIPRITDEMIDDWLVYIRIALLSEDIELARRAIRHFVSRVVIKNGAGVIYYTFPLFEEQNCRHLGKGAMDLRVSVPLTRHIHHFDIPLPQSTESDHRNPDKAQLRADILAMRARGMSYRQIAKVVGLHWTRVRQVAKSAD
jgi:hypothetical protein